MNPEERESLRQQLHKIDLLLRKINRKSIALIEQINLIQATVNDIEVEKKPIYDLLELG